MQSSLWLLLVALLFCNSPLLAQKTKSVEPDPKSPGTTIATNRAGAEVPAQSGDAIARIREEGLNHSQAAKTLSYLSDVIGPRLTGSPNLKRANEWTRQTLASWGLTNAHLEAWGPFGRGWSLKSFSAEVIEPQTIPLIGYPNAWSPGFDNPLVADVVYLDAKTNADLKTFEGKLKGKIVLAGPMREAKAPYEPYSVRLLETNLLALANSGGNASVGMTGNLSPTRSGERPLRRRNAEETVNRENSGTRGTNAAPETSPRGPRGRFRPPIRFLSFLAKEEAALVVNQSFQGDGGTLFVAAASVPGAWPTEPGSNPFTNTIRAWSTNAPTMPPQITLATEDYNRLARMIQQGEKLKMAVDLKVKFHNEDPMAYNTIAEIPGTDLKKQIVMVGAHLDSWHSGTGATDNGAGVAAVMEAVRILSVLKLEPRRTIRIALWTGEEQGLYGSKAYVSNHFGHISTNTASTTLTRRSPKDVSEPVILAAANIATGNQPSPDSTRGTNASKRFLVREKEYQRLSAYFNLDNGAGKIRGVYLQGNESVRPIFRRWLQPFASLGAETLTLADTGGTDHLPFDAIGLPGFQFIQDPLDYGSRTHHSNQDLFDRIQPDDLKQAATIIAAFLYDAAMADEKLPRKPVEL
jgi:carboxypeptidase Q